MLHVSKLTKGNFLHEGKLWTSAGVSSLLCDEGTVIRVERGKFEVPK